MNPEEYHQILKDFCIARDIAYLKEDLSLNQLEFVYEILDRGQPTYESLPLEELTEVFKETYLCYIEESFMREIKAAIKGINRQLYTDSYIDNFLELFKVKNSL